MKFLDADVKRPIASVSTIVGNKVVFGQRGSHIENVCMGPTCREHGVFVLRHDARPNAKHPKSVTLGGPASKMGDRRELGFRRRVRETRGRCETHMKAGTGKEGGAARIAGRRGPIRRRCRARRKTEEKT